MVPTSRYRPLFLALVLVAVSCRSGGERWAETLELQKLHIFGDNYLRHSDELTILHFVSEGTRLYTAAFDKSIVLWDLNRRTRSKKIRTRSGIVQCISESEGGVLATEVEGGTIYVWDLSRGELRHTLRGHGGGIMNAIRSTRIFGQNRYVASVGVDGTLRIWDLRTGQEMQRMVFSGAARDLRGLAVSEDEKWLVIGDSVGCVVVLDANTRKELRTFATGLGTVWALAVSAQAGIVVTAHEDVLVGWDLGSGHEKWRMESNRLTEVEISADQREVLATRERKILVLDVQTGKERFCAASDREWPTHVTLSRDGRFLAYGERSAVRLLDRKSGKIVETGTGFQGEVQSVAWLPGERMVASASVNGRVSFWDVETERLVGSFTCGVGEQAIRINALGCSSRDGVCAVGCSDGRVRIFNADSGRLIREVNCEEEITSVGFSRDGEIVAAGGKSGAIVLVRMATGERETVRPAIKNGWLGTIAFIGEGRTLAYSDNGRDGGIGIVDTDTGKTERIEKAHRDDVTSIRAVRGGNGFVTGSLDGTVKVWMKSGGKWTCRSRRFNVGIRACDVSSMGGALAVLWREIGGNSVIRIVETEGWRELGSTGEEYGWITALALSDDGRRVVAGVYDGTVVVWGIKSR